MAMMHSVPSDSLDDKSIPVMIVNLYKKCFERYVNEIPKVAKQHIQGEHFISNTAMTATEDSVFKNLRQSVLKLARKMTTWNTKYPLKFIQLEKHLQEKKKELPIISFKDLSKISTETPKPLNEEELMLFLKFHHEIRALVYFEDLPDYIILDTQWLSNAFKCIITADKFQLDISRYQSQCDWDDFNKKGILNSVVLEQILETNSTIFKFKKGCKANEHKDHILRVMEKFDIIICPNIPGKDAADVKPPFYVPCMIKAEHEPESDIYDMFHVSATCKKSTWLCFKFIFLPPHLKNHLIASLSRKYEIAEVPVCEPNKRPIALFKGTAVFKLQDATNLLVMFFANQIQIQVWEFVKYNNDKCFYKSIAQFVTEDIQNIISKRFKMTTVIFYQKLECNRQKPDCVKGRCKWPDKESYYFCDICGKSHDNEWSEHLPVKELKCDLKSTIKDRFDYIVQQKLDIGGILDQMMTRLVISVDDRREIEQDKMKDGQTKALLDMVIQRGGTTNNVFIDVLKECGFTELADTLIKVSVNDSLSSKSDLEKVQDYKIRLQKNYLEIINRLKHNDQ